MTGEEQLISKMGEMMDEKLADVRGSIGELKSSVGKLESTVGGLKSSVGKLESSVGTLESSVGSLEVSASGILAMQDKTIAKLVEMDAYLHEKVATKDELQEAKSEIMTHIDGFAKRQERFDHELVAARSRMDRIEGKA